MPDNNNTQNPFNHGDILGALSGDVSQIKGDTTDIKSNTELLKSIDRNLATILQNSGNWSQQSVRSRIYDTVDTSRSQGSGSNDPYQRRVGNNTRRASKSADGFVDSFFDELTKDMFGSSFKHAVQQSMKDFANALGVQVADIPSLFGKTLANQLKQSDLGKQITSRISDTMDSFIGSSMQRMRSGIDKYYENATRSGRMTGADASSEQQRWSETIDRIERNFANRRTDAMNDPTPNGSDDGNTSGSQSPEVQQQFNEVLANKLDYLYPIYTTLGLVNEGVKIIADYWTQGDDSMSTIMDVYHQTNDQISQQNNDFLESLIGQGLGAATGAPSDVGSLITQAGAECAPILEEFAAGGLSAGAAMGGIAAAAGPLVLGFIAVQAALWLVDKAIEEFKACFAPLTESFEDLRESAKKASNRFFESERKKISDQTDRLAADVRVMVETPFQILEDAANEWYDAWDNNLKTITATQGYTKADLQTLMSGYAERLRSEGLDSVLSSADISNNLAKVLESGLTGAAAEEFAYLATKLSNAMPTEDFFSYASTYASIAAAQIAAGKSQTEAIQIANKQLELFASNLLYSSRELSGGFATGLNNASNLLESAVKIANTAGISDSSMISGVLTAISGVVGSVAPDLASTLTDAIIDAALGGNTDSLVALRSQAGTGASNSAFLNSFARNPQGVLQTLFTNLSNLQNMSKDNFMEVAESLADTFGLSIGAFTRIDFATVAKAVSEMDVSLNSINSNLELLQEGQTTTTAEQLKMQKINEMILNEGLSYVLDNEAARSIQQHMWDQELAAEIMETEYSVDLTGKALEFLSGIRETINNILNFLNPFSWLKKVISISETMSESLALQSDIKAMLEAGKVGSGNSSALYNLTTYDVDRLTNKPGNLLEMMGGWSSYRTLSSMGSAYRALTSFGLESNYTSSDLLSQIIGGAYRGSSGSNSKISSRYDWNYVTKNVANSIGTVAAGAYVAGATSDIAATLNSGTSAQSQVTNKNTANLTDFFNTMESAVQSNQSFDDWVATSSAYGISDLEAAVKSYDMTISDLEAKYQEYESVQGSEYNYNQDELEQEFWGKVEQFMEEDFPALFDELKERLDRQIEIMEDMDFVLTSFFESWTNDWLVKSWSSDWLQNAWAKNWIKDAWTKNWLLDGWYKSWLQDGWYTAWLEKAWATDWLQDAWYQTWIEDAWQNSWLNEAWGEKWLNTAWNTNWLNEAWQKNWLDLAWNHDWLEKAWATNWLKKAWNEAWLTKAWNEAWLDKAWGEDWLEKAWYQTWVNENWRNAWLKDAWNNNWLKKAWATDWLEHAWKEDWLEEAWRKLWIKDTWTNTWVKEIWTNRWVNEAFEKRFVNDVIKVLWGNRWWEFFNIFRDRFGGIKTTATSDGSNGKTTIDTSDIYKIYTQETGKAAAAALQEVKTAESSETGDAVLALAKQLTKNSVELKDPQVQTNVLLSQILIVLEAIMQAENVSGGASLATTLAALGMGMVNSNTSNSAGTSNSILTL